MGLLKNIFESWAIHLSQNGINPVEESDMPSRIYKVDELFVPPEKAMAIAAMHRIEMEAHMLTDIHHVIDLMGMDNADLIAHYSQFIRDDDDSEPR